MVFAVTNQKGGVGKTTTAVNLAAALARKGHRTLLVDLDPQGNASSGLGFPKDDVSQGTLDLLLDFADLRSVLLPTAVDDLHLVPATRQLIGAEVELMQVFGREMRLKRALSDIEDAYEWVVLDCPPSLGFLTVNALAAADGVLIPVQAEYYAMEGLGELLRTMAEVRKALNPTLAREGVVVTLADSRNNLCRDVTEELRQVFGAEVFELLGYSRSLKPGAGHYNPLAEQRAVLEPTDALAQRYDVPDNDQSWRLDPGTGGYFGDISQGPGNGFLPRRRTPPDQRRRCRWVHSVFHQRCGDSRKILDAHVKRQRPGPTRQ